MLAHIPRDEYVIELHIVAHILNTLPVMLGPEVRRRLHRPAKVQHIVRRKLALPDRVIPMADGIMPVRPEMRPAAYVTRSPNVSDGRFAKSVDHDVAIIEFLDAFVFVFDFREIGGRRFDSQTLYEE